MRATDMTAVCLKDGSVSNTSHVARSVYVGMVTLLSPVMTMTRMPALRHSLMESITSTRGGSNMPTTPTNVALVCNTQSHSSLSWDTTRHKILLFARHNSMPANNLLLSGVRPSAAVPLAWCAHNSMPANNLLLSESGPQQPCHWPGVHTIACLPITCSYQSQALISRAIGLVCTQ